MQSYKNSSTRRSHKSSNEQEDSAKRTSRPRDTKSKPKARRQRSPSTESEHGNKESEVQSDPPSSEEEKIDSARTKVSKAKPKRRVHANSTTHAPNEADITEVSKPPAPTEPENGYLTVLSMAYRAGFTKTSFPKTSRIIPDTSAMFTVLYEMCSIVQENTLIHEQIPAYTSLGMYTYYAHVVHYHILRVIASEDKLSTQEMKILRTYESIAPTESWPIAAPLVPFIQSLGKCTIHGGKYGTIIPKFPKYEELTHANRRGLSQISSIAGIARLPIVPAFHEFLYKYSTRKAKFDDTTTLYPTPSPTLSDQDSFLSLTSSESDSSSFVTLALSAGWMEPREIGVDTYSVIDAQKRAIIQKWKIPSLGDSRNIINHETFLGLEDGQDKKWINQLLKLSSGFNHFFTGGVNLDAIPPITIEESYSKVTFDILDQRDRVTPANDKWYYERKNLRFNLESTILRENSQSNLQITCSTSPRRIYGTNTMPTNPNINTVFSSEETGPYFDQDQGPRVEIRGFNQPDPIDQASTIIESRVYDKTGSS
jgi:hypothetical protein